MIQASAAWVSSTTDDNFISSSFRPIDVQGRGQVSDRLSQKQTVQTKPGSKQVH